MPKSPSFLVTAAFAAAFASSADGALLIYEGFQGYNTGDSLHTNAVTPNGNTVGLATSGAGSSYVNGTASGAGTTNSAAPMVIQAGGLSIGSGANQLATAGGSVRYTGSVAAVAAANITATTSSTVFYSSYLVNLSATGAGSLGFEVRFNSLNTSNSTNAIFRSAADSRGTISTQPSVSYGLTSAAEVVGGASLTVNTNYIIISRFDISGAVGTGASLWALNSSQFDAFVLAGRTDAFLANSANVTASSFISSGGVVGTFNGQFLEFVAAGTAAGYRADFDEIRYGENLLDVVPVIPEPSSALLLCGAAGFGLARRRRN